MADILGEAATDRLLTAVTLPETSEPKSSEAVSRETLSTALCLLLLDQLFNEVPEAARYAALVGAEKRKINFDHGALRTVRAPWMGALPSGEHAITRILEPLGYSCVGAYPLPSLRMGGKAYAHRSNPAGIPQFFVSEIYPENFSAAVQKAGEAVFADSCDPLDADAKNILSDMERHDGVPFDVAKALLPVLAACFGPQHPLPALSDYQTLLAESAEFAWIATEGNRFNHATDRVDDLNARVAKLRAQRFAMKDEIEVSAAGSVRQTAFKAAQVERSFRDGAGQTVTRVVPGSFFEFIARDYDEHGKLDLRFDSSNAQGIFKMTAVSSTL